MLRNNGRKILKILFPVIKLFLRAGNCVCVVKTLQFVTDNGLKSEHTHFTQHDVMPSSVMQHGPTPQISAGFILDELSV